MSRILVVDDEYSIRIALEFTFEQMGHEVNTAQNSREALGLLAKSSYDLAFIDLIMPDEDGRLNYDSGITLLRQMEEQKATLPVIVLTARVDADAFRACVKISNVREFVTKDPNPAHLKLVVEKLLGVEPPQVGEGDTNAE